VTRVRKGQAPPKLTRVEFNKRFRHHYVDPAFDPERESIARLDRMICYYGTYATSHDDLDHEQAFLEEVRNVARTVANAVAELRAGRLLQPDAGLKNPRPK
jgi:hypothetical protein